MAKLNKFQPGEKVLAEYMSKYLPAVVVPPGENISHYRIRFGHYPYMSDYDYHERLPSEICRYPGTLKQIWKGLINAEY